MTKAQRVIVIRARAKMLKHKARCTDETGNAPCPGWAVFLVSEGFEIETCDECWHEVKGPDRLTDDEAAFLPEAIERLKEVVVQYAKEHDAQLKIDMPVLLEHELSVWQRSLGVPGLPGLTEEERAELDEELADARVAMSGVH